jgi:hypothetical protein
VLTSDLSVTYAAWALRYGRGLRPDLLAIPLDRLRGDTAAGERIAGAAKIRRPGVDASADAWVSAVAARRSVCAGPGLAEPPGLRDRTHWRSRPMVWIAGPAADDDTVPATDFVFAALKLALDAHDSWAPAAIELYRRAVRLTPALCRAVETDGVPRALVGCR